MPGLGALRQLPVLTLRATCEICLTEIPALQMREWGKASKQASWDVDPGNRKSKPNPCTALHPSQKGRPTSGKVELDFQKALTAVCDSLLGAVEKSVRELDRY